MSEDLKLHKFVIRNRKGLQERLSNGANTEVLLDGKVLKGVTGLKYEICAGGTGTLTLDFIGDIAAELNLPLSVDPTIVSSDPSDESESDIK